ncbi:PLP-dependent transferase [Bacteroides helcogenes]|uniref:Cys/Met metabolism pyridoxal-phosphate-dependent protein n=1 Tax=Bacteroides helcogenes (strain ATCC 35417 / DSM 20613 / JCM 6297 / CCUG 15421 / P 36-108) TaxID=693979 RepID=E6ST37_BACT6|nr:PLP-dependent transferase [Bacteroides helcogenes]ADV45241.1 Cys/Met metabolism pyridoxal-phosphate-dependent protein [Bacteroides helcogenes P 36-108]MDY5238802.1 PLP-dependent transferase [Bacteroides helcogenes]
MKKQTKAIHTRFQSRDAYNSLSMPVYHTAAYEFDDADEMADAFCGRTNMPDYSRVMNPTVTFFENKVKALTGAADVIALSSGMAAISNTLLCVAAAGKNIVTSRHMFGNTYALVSGTLSRFGIEARLCDLTDVEAVARRIDGNTCCVYLEIITNPQMEVADLQALVRVAHEKNVPLIADTTAIPFTEFCSHDFGVDVEVVSSTKYLSGGATSIGGLVVDYGTCPGFGKRMRTEMLLNLGAYMTPHVAYMQTIGLETLDARYRIQSANTLELARKLCGLAAVKRVNCVGLEDNPFHALAQKQFGPTAGAMITIDLEDKDACFRFINGLKLIRRATNLFDSKSLAIHPASTIFGPFTDEQRRSMDVLDTTIRLSIGLEDVDDLFEDIEQALKK